MSTMRRFAATTAVIVTFSVGLMIVPSARGAEQAEYGHVVAVAGTGEQGFSGDGYDALKARLGSVVDIDLAPDGTLYIADGRNYRLRKVDVEGVITTVPGVTGGTRPDPHYVTVANNGTLYFGAHWGIFRRNGNRAPVAVGGNHARHGDLGDGGPATEAFINRPNIALDAAGNVYATDPSNGRIRKIDKSGTITTIAGGGTLIGKDAEARDAKKAHIAEKHSLEDIAADADGNVYFTAENKPVRKVGTDGTLSTVIDESGKPISGVTSIDVDDDGHLYVAHTADDGQYIHRLDGNGVRTQVGPRLGTLVNDIAVASNGDIYVAVHAEVLKIERKPAAVDAPKAGKSLQRRAKSRFADLDAGSVKTVAGSGRRWREGTFAALPPGRNWMDQKRGAAAPDGTFYYADTARNQVRKVLPDGSVENVAGTGVGGYTGDDGPATKAELHRPTDVAVGADGSVYIADADNFRVRKVDRDGTITTVAGNGATRLEGDVRKVGDGRPATGAVVGPNGIAVGPDGSLYIADTVNERIRKVGTDGTISTVAGGGDAYDVEGRSAIEAKLSAPTTVAVDADDEVYFIDGGDNLIRKIGSDGKVTTVVGERDTRRGFGGDGASAKNARLNSPHDIAVGPHGVLYIADTHNSRIRAVDNNGVITTVAGTGEPSDSGDDGQATKAAVNEPQTIATDAGGNLYTVSLRGNRLRKIDSNGVITTIADLTEAESRLDFGDGQQATKATVEAPHSIAVDGEGTLYIADGGAAGLLRSVDNNGVIDSPHATITSDATMPRVEAVAAALDGTLYVATRRSGTTQIDRIQPNGSSTTVPRASGLGTVRDLEVSDNGELYIATASRVYRLDGDGALTTKASFGKGDTADGISGIAVDTQGATYIAHRDDNRVYKVDIRGTKSVIAGNNLITQPGDAFEGENATKVPVNIPWDVAVDRDGNIYISTFHDIYKVDSSKGTIQTLVSDVEGAEGLRSLALDPHGNLYIADTGHHRVQVIARPAEAEASFDGAHLAKFVTLGRSCCSSV